MKFFGTPFICRVEGIKNAKNLFRGTALSFKMKMKDIAPLTRFG